MPLKTRIKVETKADGSITYTPQYRDWPFWNAWKGYDGCVAGEFSWSYRFDTIDEAKAFIEQKQLERNQKGINRAANKVIRTYIVEGT